MPAPPNDPQSIHYSLSLLLQLPLSLSQILSARVLGQLEVKLRSWVQTQVCLLCQALALVEMLQTGRQDGDGRTPE